MTSSKHTGKRGAWGFWFLTLLWQENSQYLNKYNYFLHISGKGCTTCSQQELVCLIYRAAERAPLLFLSLLFLSLLFWTLLSLLLFHHWDPSAPEPSLPPRQASCMTCMQSQQDLLWESKIQSPAMKFCHITLQLFGKPATGPAFIQWNPDNSLVILVSQERTCFVKLQEKTSAKREPFHLMV